MTAAAAPDRHAVVVGAGPGGLAAAIALRKAGFRVTIVERSRSFAGGSGLTLWPNAMVALEHLDALDAVSRRGERIDDIRMLTERGRVLFEQRLDEVLAHPRYGARTLRRAALVEALAGRFDGPVRFGTEVVAAFTDFDGVDLLLDDGDRLRCDLAVGADGLHSRLRSLISSEAPNANHFVVYRGLSDRALGSATGSIWMGAGQQFGCFPLPDRAAYWFCAFKSRHRAEDREVDLRSAFAGWPDPIPSLIEATAASDVLRRESFDLNPLPSWTRGRMVLLGDAAHASAPTLGQGACQAIEDAVVLGDCMARSVSIETALALYQDKRLAKGNATILEARRFGVLGFLRNPIARFCRDAMMRSTPRGIQRRQLERSFRFML